MKTYGVIMAGGGGTRFWPLSRQKMPKQLLNLSGKELMINETIDRLSFTVAKKDIFIVTNKSQVDSMKNAVKGRVSDNHILSEPSARNTAPCIGYAAMEIIKKYGDGIMVITPADAYIKNTEKFTEVLDTAVKAAEDDKLVTVGITPDFPATGYGYIKFDKNDKAPAKSVKMFKEKPDYDTAAEYVASGEYVWNSGMFIWKASVILNKFKELLPGIYKDICTIGDYMGTDDEYDVIEKIYPAIDKISIDYGIMEKSDNVVTVPGEFGWSDVGSWDMMGALHKADDMGNISIGDVVNIDTSNTIGYSSGRLIAAVGVSNIIVVETPDAVLVCNKDKAQDVKKAVDFLIKTDRNELL